MTLVWKLLKQHISPLQLAGFLLANLFGTWVVMLGVQFYRDAIPLLTQDDAFINQNFLVVSKHVTMGTTLTASSNTFSASEVEDLREQPFCKRAAGFTSSRYKVSASMSLQGGTPLQTELFFESVPDSFVDVQQAEWHYSPGSEDVPVILPRSYVALYNFGFAQSRGLPKVSDGLIGMIDMGISVRSRNGGAQFRGRILGFSNRLNTILVPQDFMDWSNERFEPGREDEPSRLIVEVVSPADDAIAKYMQEKNYDVEDNKLDAGRATYFLRVVVSLVLLVGLLVCALSFYILMLSVYLL
ncbi:MAG: ABC transporter permease, partial [Alloprevotella sp.]|nr:ABC transporter permease [Alloprevotella sp.]